LTDKAGQVVDCYVQSMAQKKEIFRKTLDYIPNGVLLIDAKLNTISFQNKAMKGLTGVGGKEQEMSHFLKIATNRV
jgi:hypothetical protein